MPFALRPLAALAAAALLTVWTHGCTPLRPPQEKALPEKSRTASGPEDLARFPQTIDPYLSNMRDRSAVMEAQRHYKEAYYRVWDDDYVPESLEKVKWPFDVYRPETAYGQNLRPLPQSWFYAMMREANWQQYGSVGRAAIALRRLDLRNFPTAKPLFHDPAAAGEGFPFDYLQNSAVFADEPLYLSHYSESGAWAYVLTSYATGWVPSDRIALVDEPQRRERRERPLLALLEDRLPMHTPDNRYLFEGYVGMLLPLEGEAGGMFRADALMRRDAEGVRTVPAEIPEASAAAAPLRFEHCNLRRVVAPILRQTLYGWGGLYGERDCSSTVRDIFAPFGLWLPRNSYRQSQIGRVVPLQALDDEAKLAKIVSEARPFETLLYLRGHILLYLGLYDGEPAVLHTVWGVKTVDDEGNFGRYVIGRTVISSLRLGRELEGYSDEYSLLRKLVSMNFVFEGEAGE